MNELIMHRLGGEIAERYPNLRADAASPEGRVILRGTFPIRHNGKEIDRFYVEIHVPSNFPRGMPAVWETGGRIPRVLDRHVISKTGQLCVLLPEDWYIRFGPSASLLEYLDGPLYHYFVGQMCVERGQPWPQGERAHGSVAVAQYYQEFFRSADKLSTLRILDAVRQGRYKGHWDCPCGSGKIVRKCHGEAMRIVGSRIPSDHLEITVREMLNNIASDKNFLNSIRGTEAAKHIVNISNSLYKNAPR